MREPEKRLTPEEVENARQDRFAAQIMDHEGADARTALCLARGKRHQNNQRDQRRLIQPFPEISWQGQAALARQHVEAEKRRQEEWLANLQREEAEKAAQRDEEALVQEELRRFEAKLRGKRAIK
jgi:hypothetical protein